VVVLAVPIGVLLARQDADGTVAHHCADSAVVQRDVDPVALGAHHTEEVVDSGGVEGADPPDDEAHGVEVAAVKDLHAEDHMERGNEVHLRRGVLGTKARRRLN